MRVSAKQFAMNRRKDHKKERQDKKEGGGGGGEVETEKFNIPDSNC